MRTNISLSKLMVSILLNALLMIPFVLLWGIIFATVFFGISGIFTGLFLIFSALFELHISLIPAIIYEYPLILWSYIFFFIGLGGLFLCFMSILVPYFVGVNRKYYYWSQSFIKEEFDEK